MLAYRSSAYTIQMDKYNAIWNRFFILILAVALLSGMSIQFFNSTISLQVEALGGRQTFTGILMMVFTVAAAVFRLIGGHFADAFGRRPVILAGTLLFLAASVGCGLVPSLEWLVLFRVLQGAGFAVSGTATMVAVADVVEKRRIGEAVGYFGLRTSLSQAVGPMIAIGLMTGSGFSTVSFAAAAALALSIGILFFCNYEKIPQFALEPKQNQTPEAQAESNATDSDTPKIWRVFEKRAVPAASIMIFTSIASGSILAFLTLYAVRQEIANPGLFFTFSAVLTVIARLLTGRITDRFGPLFSVAPGLFFGIVTFVLLAISQANPMIYYTAGAAYGLFSGMTTPALNATAIRSSPDRRRGAAAATFQVPVEIGLALSALLWGRVIEQSSFDVVFWSCAAILLAGLLTAIILFRKIGGTSV